jgi:2,3-dihydro-2,3-dihydroxybenzoate dehydrogenase
MVTGAAQGIGEAIARRFALHGAAIAAVDRNEEGVERVAGELRASGSRAIGMQADVRDSAGIAAIVDRVERELGGIGVLINCAAVLRTGAIASFGDQDWDYTFAVNTTGVFIVSRAVVRQMLPRRSGVIVTIGSNAAAVPRLSMAAYAASKAAATHFTKCLGLELAAYGIRCNVVSPGSTDTPMQRALWADASGSHFAVSGSLESFRVGIPLGRIANAEDIADAVLFLASDNARHITMHNLCVDGGATLGT